MFQNSTVNALRPSDECTPPSLPPSLPCNCFLPVVLPLASLAPRLDRLFPDFGFFQSCHRVQPCDPPGDFFSFHSSERSAPQAFRPFLLQRRKFAPQPNMSSTWLTPLGATASRGALPSGPRERVPPIWTGSDTIFTCDTTRMGPRSKTSRARLT